MKDLIERLRAATEGSAEWDVEIACAVGREDETYVVQYVDGSSRRMAWRPDGAGGTVPTPRYSRSIEAALTLVPNGMSWGLERFPDVSHSWVGPDERTQEGATPPLALCIAALMARDAAGGR